jgi:hypothetical protein
VGKESQERERKAKDSAEDVHSTKRLARAGHGRGGGSTRIGGRAARAWTGLSLSVNLRICSSSLLSMTFSQQSRQTHPYLTLAGQSPFQPRLVPLSASSVGGVRRRLGHTFIRTFDSDFQLCMG